MLPVNRIVLQRIAALALALFWAIPLRAMAATESRSVAGFDAVVLEVPGELQIEHGPDEALSLEAEPAVLRMITADVHDRRLRIALAPGRVQTNQPIRMRLAVRSLRAFESRTAAEVRIDAVQGDAASLALAGGGAVRVERLNTLGLTVRIAGASRRSMNSSSVCRPSMRSSRSSSMRCMVSVPCVLSIEDMGPGLPPEASAVITRCSVISMALTAISSAARLDQAPSLGSSDRLAISRRRCRRTFRPGAYCPPRSNSRRYFATLQPSFSCPTRLALGTRTLSKKTALSSCSPASVTIGWTVTPGAFMSIRRNVMPVCGLPSKRVRTRPNMRFAKWACVVQILEPLTM